MRLKFNGKSGIPHERVITDRKLAAVVRRCRDVPGQHLFQYRDAQGRPHSIGSTDVNDYIRRAAGGEFTAKDFRTWAGTVQAAARLAAEELPDSVKAAERVVVRVVREVAAAARQHARGLPQKLHSSEGDRCLRGRHAARGTGSTPTGQRRGPRAASTQTIVNYPPKRNRHELRIHPRVPSALGGLAGSMVLAPWQVTHGRLSSLEEGMTPLPSQVGQANGIQPLGPGS